MTSTINRQVVLSSRPEGIPGADHFDLRDAAVPELKENEFLIQNKFLSVDPAMRGWVNAAPNYSEPVAVGNVMRSIAVGEIVETRHPEYPVGETVCGLFGWQDYAVSDGFDVWFRHDPSTAPITTALGILGLNGITAYFGLLDIGQPNAGETVVVSTAAGAVGSAVGQIARIQGCRTVGLTGSDEKIALCKETFGFDEAINYRNCKGTGELDQALAVACPGGVDVYYDNTAGAISDAVYSRLNLHARCVVCGTASVSNWDPWPVGPRVERHLLVKRARIQGFLIFDFADRFAEARVRLTEWLNDGKLAYREEILPGLDAAPGAIARLYAGDNLGKLMVEI
jgi:NADPH-dependent curcumin reductase CurA